MSEGVLLDRRYRYWAVLMSRLYLVVVQGLLMLAIFFSIFLPLQWYVLDPLRGVNHNRKEHILRQVQERLCPPGWLVGGWLVVVRVSQSVAIDSIDWETERLNRERERERERDAGACLIGRDFHILFL